MPIDYTKRPVASDSKVTLTKGTPSVSLRKSGGVLQVNLNWNARPSGGGFFTRLVGGGAIDLDLGCLYEFSTGKKGVVQALGNSFRSVNDGAPIISLDGDDRSGANNAGENLRIDLGRIAEIRRVLVFAYIYEGAPNWSQASGVVTLYPADGAAVEVHLDEPDPRARTCAIAMLDNVNGAMTVRREVRYIAGAQRQLDEAYGWGMNWTPGRKN